MFFIKFGEFFQVAIYFRKLAISLVARAYQTTFASETRNAKFFNVVVATSATVFACEFNGEAVAVVATLNVCERVFCRKAVMVFVIVEFYKVGFAITRTVLLVKHE
jgi:hypothetical protein